MRGSLVAAGVSVALITACPGGAPRDDAGPELEALALSAAEARGWRIVEGPTEHAADTLYEYLDGGAERYLTHGFTRLVHLRYQLGDDPSASVTLDLHDMGSELGAFGIYSAGRRARAVLRPWGAEGHRDGTIASAYRGAVFIHGEAADDRRELIEGLELLVASAADRASGALAPPAALAVLPRDGLVAGSQRWVADHLLGHSFLPGGLLARYAFGDVECELFVSDLASDTAALDAMRALRSHLSAAPPALAGRRAATEQGFEFTDRLLGRGTVARFGTKIAGIYGGCGEAERRTVLNGVGAYLAREAWPHGWPQPPVE